jgi:hypothetical protein
MPRYRVIVADNFHYQDPSERDEHGTYETVDEALAVCRAVVDRSLANEFRTGISAEALYDRYMSFGDDPSIVVLGGVDETARFSAWSYAKERSAAMCGGGADPAKP